MPEIEISRLDLEHFLFRQNLPLPAPDAKDKTTWFHGDMRSTEFIKIGKKLEMDDNLWDLLARKYDLEREIETWSVLSPTSITEMDKQQNEIKNRKAELERIEKAIDTGSGTKKTETLTDAIREEENYFIRSVDYWRVRFNGRREVDIRDTHLIKTLVEYLLIRTSPLTGQAYVGGCMEVDSHPIS